jgi:F-type H+-transporting ATPase subunit delta
VTDTAAKRYAVALLDVAVERGLAEKCLSDLQSFQREVALVADLRAAISNPSVPRDNVGAAARAVAQKMALDDLTAGFLGLLGQRRRLAQLPAVIAAYTEEQDRRAGRARGELVSAGPVAAGQMLKIREAVGRSLGRQLVLSQRVDPGLLGGVRVSVGDKVFDLSARTWLDSLRAHLLENG